MLAALVACLALAPARSRLAADHWERRLAAADDGEVEAIVNALAALGDSGLPPLARSLASERLAVARAARAAIVAEMDDWRRLSGSTAQTRLTSLADELAAVAPSLDETSLAFAKDVVLRILLWPGASELREHARLAAACERVLTVNVDASQAGEATAVAANAPSSLPVANRVLVGQHRAAGLDAPALLPVETFPPPLAPLPPLPNEPTEGEVASSDALPANSPAVAVTQDSIDQPVADVAAIEQASPEPKLFSGEAQPLAAVSVDVNQPASTTVDPPAPLSPPAAPRDLTKAEAQELFALLHGSEVDRDLAIAELARRGFGDTEIELGRNLASRDAVVRRRYAELLPRVAGLDAKPWLLWLSRDTDGDVRLVAVTLMATSTDPELLSRVEQMSADDDDPRVATQAARLSRTKSSSSNLRR